MAIKQSSGYVGLGSRLFLGKENTWGTAPGNGSWLGTSIYNQAGSRPQKVTSPIEVSQLYPSMLRRKPIKNTVTVEGAYTFSLPTSASGSFWELITGDDTPATGTSATGTTGTMSFQDAVGSIDRETGNLVISSLDTTVGMTAGQGAKLSGFVDTANNMPDNNPSNIFTILSVTDASTLLLEATATSFGDAVMVQKVLPGEVVDASSLLVTSDGYMQIEMKFTETEQLVLKEVTIHDVTGTGVGDGLTEMDVPKSAITGAWSKANGNVTSIEYNDNGGQKTIKINTNLEVSGNAGIVANMFNASGDDITAEGYDYIALIAENQSSIIVHEQTNQGGTYSLQEEVATSFSAVQTISNRQLSKYTGLMAQSATFNITPDDLANVEISFLGKNEQLYDVTNANIVSVFGAGSSGVYLNQANNLITSAGTGYDGCVDFYPSWSAKLLVNRKEDIGSAYQYQVPSLDIDNDDIAIAEDGWDAGTNGGVAFDDTDNAIIPFSDLSITINNNLEFPAYINGSKERNKPVQTTYKEVTGSITVPYNDYTRDFVRSMFDQDSFEFRILFSLDAEDTGLSATSILLTLPEVCMTGDSLADVPEGEMTLSINFSAYAPKDPIGSGGTAGTYETASSLAPFKITLGGTQT